VPVSGQRIFSCALPAPIPQKYAFAHVTDLLQRRIGRASIPIYLFEEVIEQWLWKPERVGHIVAQYS
jgi:hypothetical protein